MDTINKIIDLQRRGANDSEIIAELQRDGVSPKEIKDALGQARVKNAVYQEENFDESIESQNQEGMNQSIMQNPQNNTQATPEIYPAEQFQQAGQTDQNYYTQTPQGYSNQGDQPYYAPQGSADMEVITEIAEQVTSEKINELKKKIGDIPQFRSEIKDSISDLDERLRRIENSIDKLHQAIIGKIGEFGENSSLIQRDLTNIHQTMSKMMDPLIDNYKELKKIARKE